MNSLFIIKLYHKNKQPLVWTSTAGFNWLKALAGIV